VLFLVGVAVSLSQDDVSSSKSLVKDTVDIPESFWSPEEDKNGKETVSMVLPDAVQDSEKYGANFVFQAWARAHKKEYASEAEHGWFLFRFLFWGYHRLDVRRKLVVSVMISNTSFGDVMFRYDCYLGKHISTGESIFLIKAH
jgi:hypothetical protein